jgi:uncharacterized protein
MNKDITLMVELQRYWDNVLRGRSDIERSEKSIQHWNDQLKAKSNEILAMEGSLKNIKVSINEKETELSEKDEQIKKLEKRNDVIKNEKEINALEHEFIKIKTDKDSLENELINSFDFLKLKEDELIVLKTESAKSEKQSLLDIKELEERINRFLESISENQNKFDSNVDQLSAAVKTKFLKLIKSQNGKGIAIINEENCGVCNFQIPFNLIQDAIKESNIVNCTNCGRFLYKT